MQNELKRLCTTVKVATMVVFCLAVAHARGGELEPPGPPKSTMKTIQEAEPRVPIPTDSVPLTLDTPGSYYLTGDLQCGSATDDCITITADRVTIDLMGYTVSGGQNVIWADSVSGVVVKNGRVEGGAESGIRFDSSSARVVGVDAIANGDLGILAGGDSLVQDCAAIGNGGVGIYVNSRSQVVRCRSTSNGQEGILAQANSEVLNSLAVSNGSNGIKVHSARVEGCSARENTRSGFEVNSDSLLVGNIASFNGSESNRGAGFEIRGYGSRVEGNHAYNNFQGFWERDPGNVIIRNSARGNVNEYDLRSTGSDGGAGPIGPAGSASSPWANIEF